MSADIIIKWAAAQAMCILLVALGVLHSGQATAQSYTPACGLWDWVFEMVPWQSHYHVTLSQIKTVCLSVPHYVSFVWLAEEELRLSGGGSAYAHRYIYVQIYIRSDFSQNVQTSVPLVAAFGPIGPTRQRISKAVACGPNPRLVVRMQRALQLTQRIAAQAQRQV